VVKRDFPEFYLFCSTALADCREHAVPVLVVRFFPELHDFLSVLRIRVDLLKPFLVVEDIIQAVTVIFVYSGFT